MPRNSGAGYAPAGKERALAMRVCPECGNKTDELSCPRDGRGTVDEAVFVPHDPLVGQTIADRYVLAERIGSGGYGAVYRGTHKETGGDVAIKILRAQGDNRREAVRRFHLEAQNAAALRHPNTVRVNDFGVHEGLLFLVMEYLYGRPLDDIISAEAPLPWRRAVHIARQVLASVGEAHDHERRIVHRDIKPKNIVVTDQPGQPDFVKVLDFGLARSLEGAGAGTQGAIGTPKYMAPEQWMNKGVGSHTDLYAVGCVLFEMIAGRPPFVPKDSHVPQAIPLNWMHLHEAVPDIRDFAAMDLPPALADLVAALLAKDPAQRPGSAVEVINALDDLTSSQPTAEAAPTLPVLRLGKAVAGAAADPSASASSSGAAAPTSTAPPLWALVMSAVVGLSVLGLFLALGSRGEDAQPQSPEPAASTAEPSKEQPSKDLPGKEPPVSTAEATAEPAGAAEAEAEEPAEEKPSAPHRRRPTSACARHRRAPRCCVADSRCARPPATWTSAPPGRRRSWRCGREGTSR